MQGSGVFWVGTIGFLVGIFARTVFPMGAVPIPALFLLAAIFCVLHYALRAPHALAVAVLCIALAAGIGRTSLVVLDRSALLDTEIGKKVTVIGFVSAEPDARESQTQLTIHVTQLVVRGATTQPINVYVLASVPPHAGAEYGDVVEVAGVVNLPKPFETEGAPFNYPGYLAVRDIAYQLSFAHAAVLDTPNAGNPFLRAIISLKRSYEEGLGAVLPEPAAGLAGGITVGDKRSIGPELTKDFQTAGLMQIVVLSGYNITIVTNALLLIFRGAGNIVRFGVAGSVVAFFVALSGGASSAVRAGGMALLAMYARTHRRTFDGLRAVLVTSCVMALWNPLVIVYDPGFQLSALAIAGLSLCTPLCMCWCRWIPTRFALREVMASTIAVQLMIEPLILYQDGTLSLVTIPATILATAPVPAAMLASFVAAIAGMIAGSAGTLIAFPTYVLLSSIIAVAQTAANVPSASVVVHQFTLLDMVLWYLALGVVWYIQKRRAALARPASIPKPDTPY